MSCSLLGCGFGSAKKSNAGMCTSVLPMLKRKKCRSRYSKHKVRKSKSRKCRSRKSRSRKSRYSKHKAKKSRSRKYNRRSFGYQVLSNDQIIRLVNSNVLKCA